MITEVETLRDALVRVGLPAHAHVTGQPQVACGAGEVCICEEDPTTALVVSPDDAHKVHVDPMTAYAIIADLPAGVDADVVWRELDEIDHGA